MLPVGSELFTYAATTKDRESHTSITIKRGTALPLFPTTSILLPSFWNGDLDANCLICDQSFQELDPPIRTVSLEQMSPLVIQVHNRHLGCIYKYGTPFIPISHVWHESIAAANFSQKNNLEASECLFKVLSEILPTVTAKFSDLFGRVEVWHDYLSIPQWQRPVQQALLLMLPHIYRTAPLSLIHLDDVTFEMITTAADYCSDKRLWAVGERSRSDYPKYTNSVCFGAKDNYRTAANQKRYGALTRFFRAQWFQRMWVSLEYAYCRQACVYTEDHVILWDGRDYNYDSFSRLFNGFQQRMRTCVEELGMHDFSKVFRELPMPLLGPLADMRKNVCKVKGPMLSFGEALTFVAGRNCTCYRDRFLAMSSFLKIGDYAGTLQNIPHDAAEACLWLARKCLENGDYSPLLMLRRNETLHPQARWLVGHQEMSWDMWDLGLTRPYPHEIISIKDELIQLQLGHVGTVEKLWVLDFKTKNHIATFDFVVETILSHYGGINIPGFLNTLDRIYAVPTFLRSDSSLSRPLHLFTDLHPESFQSLLALHLQHQLGSEDRLKISGMIAQLLQLYKQLKGTAADLTRLSYASNPLHQVDGYSDCLAAVRCPSCAKSFLYRVSILKHVDGPVYLYRIPELECASSLWDGVGLLISEKEIVGRMIYGIPACSCKVLESVEIC